MQFTEKQIQALKPKEQRYDIREKSGSGFAVRVFTSGEKSWIFFYNFEGRKRRMTLGSYPALSLSEARSLHRNALTILAHGNDPGLSKQKEKLETRLSATIEALIHEYIEKWAKPRKRSWQEDERILLKDVQPAFRNRKARDITKRDILLLLDKIKERNAPIAANRTLACVRRLFNFAVERDIITSSPCSSIKAPAKENRRERCLSLDEIRCVWDGLPKARMSLSTQLVLKFQLVTAQRKGEVITAEWSDFDITAGWWTIPASKAKNDHVNRVPLSKLAIQLLDEIKTISGDSHWLFPAVRGDGHIGGQSIDHAVRRSIEVFEVIDPWTPHDLRRTAATHITGMGIPRLVVSKLLNHAENSVTAIYDRHSYDAEKKHALDVWATKLQNLIDGVDSSDNIIALKKIGG